MSLAREINFPIIGDDRGSLIAIETGLNKIVDFDIKRVYYIFGTKEGVARGFHAHKKLRQLAIAVSGSCRMLLDSGVEKEYVVLDNINKAVVIDPMVWHEMDQFSSDCVLLVLASDYYDECDYIRDYKDFLRVLK